MKTRTLYLSLFSLLVCMAQYDLFAARFKKMDAASLEKPEKLSKSKAEKEEIENGRSPIGCKDMGHRFDLMTLELTSNSVDAKQSLYFLYNGSSHDIGLYQMLGEESARSLFLNHKINAKQWGVLSTSQKHMRYLCTIQDGKTTYGKIIDCAKVLKVCEYNNVRYGLNNQGNYWLVNSNTRNGAVNAVVRYGIIPGT